MADLLDDQAVDDALTALPGWSRRGQRLVRAVDVPDDAADNLAAAVARTADEMDHHPDVSRSGGTTTFTLWTHSAGGITAKDVELAGRIDQALSGTVQDPPG